MKLAAGPIPLYIQLEQGLKARIEAGEFKPGDCLPTEELIGQYYGVSRITVRKALEALETQGLILRRRGVGSFVAEKREGIHAVQLRGSLDEFLLAARDLAPTVLSMGLVPGPDAICDEFGLPRGSAILRLELISSIEEGPTAHSLFYFLPETAGHLTQEEVAGAADEPIIRLVERKLGVRVGKAVQELIPDLADGDTPRHLGIEPGSPILKVRRQYFSTEGELIEIAELRYHPGRYRYEVELKANPYLV